MTRHRRLGRAVTLAAFLVIAVATLTPNPGQAAASAETPFSCLICGDGGMRDVLLNVLLFVPYGLGLGLSGVSTRRVIGLSFLLTATVEFLQYMVVTGRDSSLSDILTNTLGGTLGALLATGLPSLLRPGTRLARKLGVMAAGLWLLILTLTTLALYPWAPNGPFVSEWARPGDTRPPFSGSVRSASLSGHSMAEGPSGPRLEMRHEMLAGRTDVRAEVRSGPPPASRSWILVLRGPKKAVLGLSQKGTSLVFEPPTYTYRLRLDPPAIRLGDALPAEANQTVHIAGQVEHGTIRLSAATDGESRSTTVAMSPGLGWSLLLPFDHALGPEVHLLTALWLAALALPLGFWWAQAGLKPVAAAAGLAGIVAVGLGLLPIVAGFPPVHWSAWVAAAAGSATGWALVPRAAYLQGRCASPSTSVSSSS